MLDEHFWSSYALSSVLISLRFNLAAGWHRSFSKYCRYVCREDFRPENTEDFSFEQGGTVCFSSGVYVWGFSSGLKALTRSSAAFLFMGYLPDRNQRGLIETKRRLVALELAHPLKTRGRRQALPGCAQKWEQLLPSPLRPTEGQKVKGRPKTHSQDWKMVFVPDERTFSWSALFIQLL